MSGPICGLNARQAIVPEVWLLWPGPRDSNFQQTLLLKTNGMVNYLQSGVQPQSGLNTIPVIAIFSEVF